MSSFFFIQIIFLNALVCYLWAYSDFLPYYLNLVRKLLPKKIWLWLMVDDYLLATKPIASSYCEYLHIQKSNPKYHVRTFILKLLSCKICFTAWSSLVFSFIFGGLLYWGLYFFLSLFISTAFNFILKILQKDV